MKFVTVVEVEFMIKVETKVVPDRFWCKDRTSY